MNDPEYVYRPPRDRRALEAVTHTFRFRSDHRWNAAMGALADLGIEFEAACRAIEVKLARGLTPKRARYLLDRELRKL